MGVEFLDNCGIDETDQTLVRLLTAGASISEAQSKAAAGCDVCMCSVHCLQVHSLLRPLFTPGYPGYHLQHNLQTHGAPSLKVRRVQ